MYRFVLRPAWLLSHVFAATLVVLFVNLGFWQLDRHDEKADRNATVVARTEMEIVPVGSLLDEGADVASLRFRTASATGTFESGADVLIDNRSNDGLPGAWIVTPLRLADGTLLAVSRGFQQVDSGRIDPPAPPAGPVEVLGTVLPWDDRSCGVRTAADGTPVGSACLRRDAVEGAVGEPVAAVVLQRISSTPADAEVLVPVPLPELDAGPHRSYAAQWFIFATIGLVGYPLILRRVARERRAGVGSSEPDPPEPDPEAPSSSAGVTNVMSSRGGR